MNEENQSDAQIKDEQTSAILATSTIIIFFVIVLEIILAVRKFQ
jgi:hypothetical protein